jgi:phospholipase/carboxylesterase
MHDLIVQQGAASPGQPNAPLLCFHGVGASAEDLRPLAARLAQRQPHAWVVIVQSPDPSDLGGGRQWFSVRGVTDTNRAERVAAAMPGFIAAVTRWQQRSGSDAAHTTLLGFSQGAIMALATVQLAQPVAGRVVAMAGRLAGPLLPRPIPTRIHLLHGQADGIVPAEASVVAHAQLAAAQADVTLDLFPGLGHGIDARMMARLDTLLAAT